MSAPLIQTVIPFDATQDYVLSFSYLGFQVRKNKVIIRDNTTNLIVYEQKNYIHSIETYCSSKKID